MGGYEIPRHWRLRKQRYGLVGEICPHCDHKIFPPRDICPNCGDEAKETPIPYAPPQTRDKTTVSVEQTVNA